MQNLRLALAIGSLVICTQLSMAQDTTVKKPDSITQKSDTAVAKSPTFDVTNIPTTSLIYTILTVMGAMLAVVLPAIQLVLKKIPGTSPIGGFLGKILNVLTFLQANVHVPQPPPKE